MKTIRKNVLRIFLDLMVVPIWFFLSVVISIYVGPTVEVSAMNIPDCDFSNGGSINLCSNNKLLWTVGVSTIVSLVLISLLWAVIKQKVRLKAIPVFTVASAVAPVVIMIVLYETVLNPQLPYGDARSVYSHAVLIFTVISSLASGIWYVLWSYTTTNRRLNT